MMRWFRHLITTRLSLRHRFGLRARRAIKRAVAASEKTHGAEIRVAIETALNLRQLLRGVTARRRALDVFAELGVWDTERNNGVLIYILLAEHDIEIVADRGFTGRVGTSVWEEICAELGAEFAEERYQSGVLAAIERIGALSAVHFPPEADDRNELPDDPAVI